MIFIWLTKPPQIHRHCVYDTLRASALGFMNKILPGCYKILRTVSADLYIKVCVGLSDTHRINYHQCSSEWSFCGSHKSVQAFYYALFYLMLLFPALKGHQKSIHASGLKDPYAQYSAMRSRDLSPVSSPSSGGTRGNSTRPMSETGPEHFILCNAIPSFVENFKFKTLMRRIK